MDNRVNVEPKSLPPHQNGTEMLEKRKTEVDVTEVSSTGALPSPPLPQMQNPPHDRPLHRQRPLPVRVLLLMIDIVLALSPSIFLGISFAAIAYNGRPIKSDHIVNIGVFSKSYNVTGGAGVIQAAQVAVSIFPILFAAIVGRFMKAYALHRAEQGSEMGLLEALYGSQSLSSTIQLSFALRGPGILGVLVVVLWLLSPLGGQGVQRVLGTGIQTNSSYTRAFYTNTSSSVNAFANHYYMAQRRDGLNVILSGALLSNQLTTTNDIWGNMKVPLLESINITYGGGDPAALANGTQTLSVDPNSVSSSLVGVLINGITNETWNYMEINTSYISLSCKDAMKFQYSTPYAVNETYTDPGDMRGWNDFVEWSGPLLYNSMLNGTNASATGENSSIPLPSWTFFLDVRADNAPTNGTTGTFTKYSVPPTFIYASQPIASTANQTITAYECTSEVVLVETSIYCEQGSTCIPLGMRRIPTPPGFSHPVLDTSSNDNGHGLPMELLLSLINSFSSSGEVQTNPIDWYISGSKYPFRPSNEVATPDYSGVDTRQVSYRITQLINTAWLAGVQYVDLAQPVITNLTYLNMSDPASPSYQGYSLLDYEIIGTTVNLYTDIDIYQVHWVFVIVAIAVSFLLLVLGFLGIHYRMTNQHPDVLGFVSTMTRDNPNFNPPPQAELLDGYEMARYYKTTKVQLVNTAQWDEQARITLRRYHQSSGDL